MSATRPLHAAMDQFPVVDGELTVGGMRISTLAARVGATPFYAYDRALITQRVAELRQTLPAAIELHFAVKANPMPAVVQHLAGLVDGLDVASAGELQVALDTGIDPADVSFAGPAKTDVELRAAIAAGITLNLESAGETERAARIGAALGVRPNVAVRVNPDFELKASGMKMGGGPKQFGVDAEQVPALLERIGQLDLRFRGFHIFWGSQNLRTEALIEAHDKTFELGLRLADAAPAPTELFNIGGGFGIPYFPGEQRLDLSPVADNLQRLLPQLAARQPQARPIIELGRYLVGEAGIYVCEVIDRKVSRGQVFLVSNGGLHHHLAASGNFGQVIRKNYPVAVATRMHGTPTEIASVVGPLCTPLDLLADRMELPQAEVGDLIVVYQSGAYGRSASPAGFLSHPPCAEVLV
ncbi:pyridoxal-dependent decarboxylase, exosortase A system-associated [Plasticicumulans acidivorans]|uniref:Diaminopimelate decarboxylase n=1 Tax=Plasticicumulans acidivorans TaxID=886464 RepID=A0A317MX83_9GAMM|nr:pyridoxal-dependent decarboxylase, exosortase A system-associated [Plasticicumulans acidivorans]PWV63350.1 diaminopimelate decarboxylase [Plasticicumulans acidivorans]